MYVLTPAYAHLEFDSKLKSADKMAWIGNTSLSLDMLAAEPTVPPTVKNANTDNDLIQDLPDFMQSLFDLGVSPETVRNWLKQADFTGGKSLDDSFQEFQRLSRV